MRIHIKYSIITLLLLLMTPELALAKKRSSSGEGVVMMFVPVSVPSTSKYVELVLDLPDIRTLKRKDGRYIDLGYQHISETKGEWVGYVGSDVEYLPLSEGMLRIVMAAAGLSELPPVPAYNPPNWFLRLISNNKILTFLLLAGLAVTLVYQAMQFAERSRRRAVLEHVSTAESGLLDRLQTPSSTSHSGANSRQANDGKPVFGRRD